MNKTRPDFSDRARRIASAFGPAMMSGVNNHVPHARKNIFPVPETAA